MTKYRLLRIMLGLVVAAALVAPAPSRAAAAAPIRVRIGVVADGIARITPADLAGVGIDPAAVDPRTFSMSSLGQPVAIRVTGESDGRFDAGDQIEFFGQRFRGTEMEEKYTDERVYWLDVGGAAGPRIPDMDATPRGDLTPPTDFPTTVHAEENTIWWLRDTVNPDTKDTWFWRRLQPLGAGQGVTVTVPYTVPFPAPGFAATLRLVKISRSRESHRTTIALNDTFLLGQDWNGFVRKVFTATVPAGLLVSGTNTVKVGAWNQAASAASSASEQPDLESAQVRAILAEWTADLRTDPQFDGVKALGMLGIVADDVFVNYWEVDYRRLFRAWNGQLDFTAEFSGAQEFTTEGWPSGDVSIWDVSNSRQPQRQIGATASASDGAYAVRFRATPAAGARFWQQSTNALARPASIRLRPDTGLRAPAGGADAVIVTHASLRPAAEALANWHRAHGRRALVADVQDVYDEFNEGIFHPQAIPAMLAWAQTHWAGPGCVPRYLTLVGDGHWNFKNYNTARYGVWPQMIPPFLAWVDPWQGEVPSETAFGDLNGDGLPEIAVGRLAVNSLNEAWTVVNKITGYDERGRTQPWQQRAVFIADRADNSGDYAAHSEGIIRDYLPADMTAQRIFLGVNVADAASAKLGIIGAVNAGAFMAQYTGHGSISGWSHESILTTADIPQLTNGSLLPLIMTFNCLDGYYAYPGLPSMAEAMQRHPGGGSIAAVSPTGLGLSDDHDALRRLLMDEMFVRGTPELGRALVNAQLRFYNDIQGGTGTPNYLIQTIMLYGDPAMRVPPAAAPQYHVRLPLVLR